MVGICYVRYRRVDWRCKVPNGNVSCLYFTTLSFRNDQKAFDESIGDWASTNVSNEVNVCSDLERFRLGKTFLRHFSASFYDNASPHIHIYGQHEFCFSCLIITYSRPRWLLYPSSVQQLPHETQKPIANEHSCRKELCPYTTDPCPAKRG